MDALRTYLIQITAAALVCAVINSLMEKKGSVSAILRMMCGIFMTVTLLNPILEIRLSDLPDYFLTYSDEADQLVAMGQENTKNELAEIIKEQVEAYILDEAGSVGAEIEVDVELSGEDIPTPCGVRIVGNVSPYGKKRLQQIIKEELGIPMEAQLWVS